jgi:hypothetical protein
MRLSKRSRFPILRLLGAMIACCAVLNFSSLLGMVDTATNIYLSSQLTLPVDFWNQPLARKNYVGDARVAQTDVWCHGCRFQKIITNDSSQLSCGNVLSPYVNQTQHKMDIQRVIAAYPDCSLCAECSQGLYYRYDEVAPKIKQGHSFYMQIVPEKSRYPPEHITNASDFIASIGQAREMLWEYNLSEDG